VDINDEGEEISVAIEQEHEPFEILELDEEVPPLTGPTSLVDPPSTAPKKYYIDNHPVEIAGTVVWTWTLTVDGFVW